MRTPRWVSLGYLRSEVARTSELVEAVIEQADELEFFDDATKEEQAIEWAESERDRAYARLEFRERELLIL